LAALDRHAAPVKACAGNIERIGRERRRKVAGSLSTLSRIVMKHLAAAPYAGNAQSLERNNDTVETLQPRFKGKS
jgi:hypothetical protein